MEISLFGDGGEAGVVVGDGGEVDVAAVPLSDKFRVASSSLFL